MRQPGQDDADPVDRADVEQRLLRSHPGAAPGLVVATVGVVLRRLRRRPGSAVRWREVHDAADEQLLLGRATRHEHL